MRRAVRGKGGTKLKEDLRSFSNQWGHVAVYRGWLFYKVEVYVRGRFTGISRYPTATFRFWSKTRSLAKYVEIAEYMSQEEGLCNQTH